MVSSPGSRQRSTHVPKRKLCLTMFEAKRVKKKASRERKHARRAERLAKGPGGNIPAAAPPAQTA
ncbi:hypothetical protein F2Q70_00021429 [Brassica cretica]|uniref:Uncharacterized protein n=2 Tax=Brassica cretica TaxID=69181 RepID=A0A8S9HED1_BRACR|nr:hypothetical protein F2Q70_00021429 [Brassica cretica]KAF2555450.1 hypothetical protein F2Q68_00014977 [Brassica cretica]KAF3605621.1 hypothetical protein DY000_02047721 [Brassica cretica]